MRIPISDYQKLKRASEHFDKPMSRLFMQSINKDLKDFKTIKPKRKAPPKADPKLLRQLASIGNNLNQVTRRINQGDKTVEVLSHILNIERKMEELIELHNICMEKINAHKVH